MDIKDLLKKYRARLVGNGVAKSVFIGLTAGFTAVGAVAFAAWIAGAPLNLLIGLTAGVGPAVALLCSFGAYFKRYRPTIADAARRLDALGMDERIVTMCEFEKDCSELAAIQRKDAGARLNGVAASSLKSRVPLQFLLLAACSFIFAASFLTVSVLASAEVIKSGGEMISGSQPGGKDEAPSEEEYFTVRYSVLREGTGTIAGQTEQTVKKGGYTEEVTAVPAEGYVFYAWVDEAMRPVGSQENPRADLNVRADLAVYAMFYKTEEGSSGSGSTGGPGGEDQNQGGEDGGSEEGGSESGPGGSGQGSSGGGGGSEVPGGGGPQDIPGRENNKVIDGTQDYRENFDREQYESDLEEDNLPDDLKDILKDYYDILKP